MNKLLLYFFQLVLGCSLLAGLFYARIIRVRLPKDILTTLTLLEDLFFSFMVIVSCITVILTISKHMKTASSKESTHEQKPIWLHIWLQRKITIYFKESIFVFYCFLLKNNIIFSLNEIIIRRISNWLYRKADYYLLLIYSTYIIPKICLAFIFLLDIFYFKQLNYFYKCLFLYLIPLTIKTLFVIMEHYSKFMTDLWFEEYLEESIDKDDIPCLIATKKAPYSYEYFSELEYPFLKFIGSIAFFGNNCLSALQQKSFVLLGSQIAFMLGWVYLLLLRI